MRIEIILKKSILKLLQIYQGIFSPVLHTFFGPTAGCRFVPSCSEYMKQSIELNGVYLGVWQGTKRICRCHPFGSHGVDPVIEVRK